MGKPVLNIKLITADEKTVRVKAVFETGSFYTIVREDILPEGTQVIKYKTAKEFGTAGRGGKIRITGETGFVICIGDKMVDDRARVSPDLNSEMIIGAETMQSWDITIKNKNGSTEVIVGHDMRDPEITEVD